ncbi:MAG: hypothetical protein ACYTHM_25690 [Planctomycetota bacterium]|jgi:hypothetical protein
MDADEYFLRLERELMVGSGRWVAEFSESFRDFPLGDRTFNLFVRGGLRPRGVFLSRLFAYFSLPDWSVAFFAARIPEGPFDLEKWKSAVEEHAGRTGSKWTWLLFLRAGPFPGDVVKRVEQFDEIGLGITLVNLAEEDVDTSDNILGRKVLPLVRRFR